MRLKSKDVTFSHHVATVALPFVDGFNANLMIAKGNLSKETLKAVTNEFSKLPDVVPVFHNMGNHELSNFSH